MSFVAALRDYIDFVNNIYDSVSGDLNFFQLGQHTLSYVFQTVLYIFYYIFTFQWLKDFVNLPVVVPQISLSIFKENLGLVNPNGGIFSFVQTPNFETNKFFIGVLNSFFLSLPISCSNLIIFRRLLIQGIPAGISAALGSIFGHFFFLATIFFGIRFFFLPWLSFDSIQYLLGLVLILASVYSMSHEVQLTRVKSSSTIVLLKMFALNFALAWTEQSCIFQYIGNLTFSGEPTILETLSARNQIDSFLIHISYLVGILVGSLFFSFFFCFLAYRLTSFLRKLTGILYSESIEKINFILISAIIGLSLASVPFYGLDYLITKPLGFVSQDQVFANQVFIKSIFNPGSMPKIDKQEPYNTEKLKEPFTDVAPLDRARYLEGEKFNNTFDELNFQGEYAWKTREERRVYNRQESSDFISNLFKKPRQEKTSSATEQPEENQLNLSSPPAEDMDQKTEFVLKDLADRIFLSESFQIDHISPNPYDDPVQRDEIKKRYYSNPVYKKLLSTDIDFFLSRQPSNHSITASDEKSLFNKRLLLADYYDSLRFYNEMQEFQDNFSGTKSYANRVYNQQFKGTYSIVRRLFSLDVAEGENNSNDRVLKYDQPLYNNQGKKSPFVHEEVLFSKKESDGGASRVKSLDNTISFDRAQAKPFYAGWDNDQRKFIITNRFLPRAVAGYKLPAKRNSFQKDKTLKSANFKFVDFSAWPLNSKVFENKEKSNIPSTFLYKFNQMKNASEQSPETGLPAGEFQSVQEYLSQPLNENVEPGDQNGILPPVEVEKYLSNLPTNIIIRDANLQSKSKEKDSSLFDLVAPKRGGFIWPGRSELKINLSQLQK